MTEKGMPSAAVMQIDARPPASPVRQAGSWRGVFAPGFRADGKRLDPDLQLVEQCMSGHEAAWEELVRVHTRRVFAVCYRFTGTSEEAQDLTQEVFLRVFKTLKSFRAGEGSFSVWLNRLTRNLLIDHYRRTRHDRKTESLDDQLPRIEESTAVTARADGMLAGREASELLQAALQKLSPELRERSEEHTSELQSQSNLVCRLLLEKKKKKQNENNN